MGKPPALTAKYHYTECGLDNVWLLGGFEWSQGRSGRQVIIHNIDGLHRAIARALVEKKGLLTGPELRFLRLELLLSQAGLAALLQVAEQTVHRWEAGKTSIAKPAETLMRLLHSPAEQDLQRALKRIAGLAPDCGPLCFDHPRRWHLCGQAAA